MAVHFFTFSDFSENTYVVSCNETKECAIIDPGCYYGKEQTELAKYIQQNKLKPVKLLNTHCHLDHVFGNAFVNNTYGLLPETHKGEIPVLESVAYVCNAYGIRGYEESPMPEVFWDEGDTIEIGKMKLEVLFVPGHSPAHIAFYNRAEKYVIGGDVLFQQSIGRTDLPGGNYDTLINSIKTKFFPLGDEVMVFSGHGEPTTIGHEKQNNPFFNE